jgi:hypothetical protein
MPSYLLLSLTKEGVSQVGWQPLADGFTTRGFFGK